jgi:DNA-binding LacI/PurR family transcriptional regulator
MEAAKQLGYHPNRAARALVMGRTRVVGLWTPPLTSAHLQRVFQGLSDTFRMAGFDSLYSRHSPDFSTHPFEWPVDGIVCVEGSVERHVEPFPEGVPVVVIGSRLLKGLDLVHIDLTAGTVESIMHLLEIGRTRIVCISGEEFDGEGSITHTYCRIMESAGHPSRCLAVRSSNHRQTLSEVRAFLGSNDKFDAVTSSIKSRASARSRFRSKALWSLPPKC